MPSLSRFLPVVTLGLVVTVSAAGAVSRLSESPEFISRGIHFAGQTHPEVQQALSARGAWKDFEARHGSWTVVWNEDTGTPHRAFGRSIALPEFDPSPSGADRAVRSFMKANPAWFGASPQLENVSSELHGNVWYVRYHQMIGTVPILFSDWEFRVGRNGKLMLFGADAHDVPAALSTSPRIPGVVAREAAKTGLPFDRTTDQVTGGTDLYFLPVHEAGTTHLRLAYDVHVRTANPRGNWATFVDAENGDVLWRQNRIRHASITGSVKANVHPVTSSDPLQVRPLAHVTVTIGTSATTETDAAGNYSGLCTGTSAVKSALSGPYCKVTRLDCDDPDIPCDGSFNSSAICPSTKNIQWDQSNSEDSERDAYYHTMVIHDYIKALDPTLTGIDFQVTENVNDLTGECDAFWDGASTINFAIDAAECVNIATVPDMIYHEYGHIVNDKIYIQHGAPTGLVNEALDEGYCDIQTSFIGDNPIIGENFYGPGTNWRALNTGHVWPQDLSADAHETGLILGGAFWDLRQAIGLPLAQHLSHYAKFGLPDNDDDGTAMNEYFQEVLVADDDDNDLSNGTPHFSQIVTAFNAHGIGTDFYINITHTPEADQPTNGPYPITATFTYSGSIGGLDTNSPTLYYSVNGIPFVAQQMSPTGNPDEWGGEIPVQAACVARYYIQAYDILGGVRTVPPAAPARRTYSFVGGPASSVISATMEADPGWSTFTTGDSASSGTWIRADPVGTVAQPEDDHTASGTMCYVTGNGPVNDPFPGTNDVDDGKTTLTTTAFNALPAGPSAIISYWRWYSNNAGELPNVSIWRVDISNNGGSSWVPVENTTETDQSWRRVVFYIKDYVSPSANMKLRFVASDYVGALVEAAVDDFDLLGFPVGVSVGPPGGAPAVLALSPAAPNPFRALTEFRYTLPAAGRASLEVFDIGGRVIRELVATDQTAGPHTMRWDGRDSAGRPVASGPYFVRLSHGGRRITQAVVRIR